MTSGTRKRFVAGMLGAILASFAGLGFARQQQEGVVEKAGAWYSFDSTRIGQGRENSKTFLKANPEIAAKIEARIRENSAVLEDIIAVDPSESDSDAEVG